MSNIQYDNANFKDKLTYLLGERNSPIKIVNKKQERSSGKNNKNGDNLLDLLGQFSAGKNFYEE